MDPMASEFNRRFVGLQKKCSCLQPCHYAHAVRRGS